MKIQGVSGINMVSGVRKPAQNFKGLFTDRSANNNGNWLMEYRPYSWEHLSRMVPKERFDLADIKLPDNEEIYERTQSGTSYMSESSKDILGTVSYYKYIDGDKDIMRSTITEKPSMNLEDSLKVKYQKLGKFIDMKHDTLAAMELDFEKQTEGVCTHSQEFNSALNRAREMNFLAFWGGKSVVLDSLSKRFNNCYNELSSTLSNILDFIKIRDSIDSVKHERKTIKTELAKIEQARINGNLIDISRRDIKDPNKALWDALQNLSTAPQKLVAMCHRTIPMKELLDTVGSNIDKDKIAPRAISLVENLMQKRA